MEVDITCTVMYVHGGSWGWGHAQGVHAWNMELVCMQPAHAMGRLESGRKIPFGFPPQYYASIVKELL